MPADLFARKAREFVGRHTSGQAGRRTSPQSAATPGGVAQDQQRRVGRDPRGGVSITPPAKHVLAAWRRTADQLWHDDGGRDGSPDEKRSHTQRRADALAELICTTTPERSIHPKHHVHIVWNLDEPSPDLAGRRSGARLRDATRANRQVIGHVFNGNGQPLWQGRRSALRPKHSGGADRRRHEAAPNAARRIDRCQAHHQHEWMNGGGTDLDNLELLCHTCHGHAHRNSRGGDQPQAQTDEPSTRPPPPRTTHPHHPDGWHPQPQAAWVGDMKPRGFTRIRPRC